MTSGNDLPQRPHVTLGKFQNVDLRVARVVAAPLATDTTVPCRIVLLDLGHLGTQTSVGQFVLLQEKDLVGKNVVVCVNLGFRDMGSHRSEALILGAPHPDGPLTQAQATPILAADSALPGASIY